MTEELKTQIKAALVKARLSEDLVSKFNISKEEDIDAIVKTLKDQEALNNLSGDELAKKIKDLGLSAAIEKLVNTKADQRATKAVQSHDEKVREKYNLVEKKDDDESDPEPEGDDKKMSPEQKMIKDLTKQVSLLADTVTTLTDGKANEKLELKLQAELKSKGLPENLAGQINVTDITKVEEAVELFKKTWDEGQQVIIDTKIKDGDIPGIGDQHSTVAADTIKGYAEKRNKDDQGSGDFAIRELEGVNIPGSKASK